MQHDEHMLVISFALFFSRLLTERHVSRRYAQDYLAINQTETVNGAKKQQNFIGEEIIETYDR